jgi:hypothetical protein
MDDVSKQLKSAAIHDVTLSLLWTDCQISVDSAFLSTVVKRRGTESKELVSRVLLTMKLFRELSASDNVHVECRAATNVSFVIERRCFGTNYIGSKIKWPVFQHWMRSVGAGARETVRNSSHADSA